MTDIGKPVKKLPVTLRCKRCDGTGQAPGKTKPKCPKCQGTGKVTVLREEDGK